MSQATRSWSGESPIPRRGQRAPLPRAPRRPDGQRGPRGRGGQLQQPDLHPHGDPLPVPLSGVRPRPFVPRLGRAADRLAGVRDGPRATRRPAATAMRAAIAHRGRPPAGPRTARRGEAEAPESWLWKGRRVYLVDGTTASMPDTPENQAAFPQPTTQRRGLGFPMVRLAVLIALWTGLARDLAMGPYKGKETGETALFRKMLDVSRRAMWWSGTAVSPRISCWRGYRGGASMGRSGCTRGGSATSVAGGSSGVQRSHRGMDQAGTAGLDERSQTPSIPT